MCIGGGCAEVKTEPDTTDYITVYSCDDQPTAGMSADPLRCFVYILL